MLVTNTGSACLRDVNYAASSDHGAVRAGNEDRWLVEHEEQVFIVADGISSQQAGGLAAQVAVEAIAGELRAMLGACYEPLSPAMTEEVCDAVSNVSSRIRAVSAGVPGIHGLGSTVVVVVVRQLKAMIVHLGDSRGYRVSQSEWERLTVDHTVENSLTSSQSVTRNSTADRRLSRYVGMPERAVPSGKLIDLRPLDRLLLCTDGLTSVVPENMVRDILRKQPDAREACEELQQAARSAGAPDNVTVLVIDVHPVSPRKV